MPRLALACALLLATAAGGQDAPRTLRILFVGNSLTAAHDLPEMVAAMAAAAGQTIEVRSSTPPDVDLRDHWRRRAAKILLASEPWDVVVLQQGPSTRPENREHLERWSGRWADAIRRRSARPALYMVWPLRGQEGGFELVSASYRAAAAAHDLMILPAGEAWKRALEGDSSVALYDADGLHPTLAGSYLAALVIAHGAAGIDPLTVPSRLTLASGAIVELQEEAAGRLREAAAEVAREASTEVAAETVPPPPGTPR